jgi:glycosyltransferase involved in cell wall biosynthesis
MEKHAAVHMGGAELQADLLARELGSREGAQVFYLTRWAPSADIAARYPYQIRSIGSGKGYFRKRAVIFDARGLGAALRDIRPAAIYQRMKQSYTGICARHARQAGIPLFFHAAIDLDLSTDHRRDRSILNRPIDMLETAVANYGVRRATRLIVQTDRQAQLARTGFGRSDALVIPNFQPLPEVLPGKGNGRICVLWVANIHANKRPELFLELAARFAGRRDIEFVMIGRPNEHWQFGRGMAEIHEAKNVRYLARQPIEEVNRWMERADIFVNTSSVEGFPNTFIQAWARGAIVASVAVDIDAGMEKLGIGYCCGSVERLAAVVDELSGSEGLRHDTRERAFAYVQDNHSMKNARRLADLIIASTAAGA